MTDLYRVVVLAVEGFIPSIQPLIFSGRCVTLDFKGLDSDSSSRGDTKSFYLMMLYDLYWQDYDHRDSIAQSPFFSLVGLGDNKMDEKWLYENVHSVIQYVQHVSYKDLPPKPDGRGPYFHAVSKVWLTSKKYTEHIKPGMHYRSRAFCARADHLCLAAKWDFDTHVSFPKYFRNNVLHLLWINKISWHLPKDIFGEIIKLYAPHEQKFSRNFVPHLDPVRTFVSKAPILSFSDFFNVKESLGLVEADYKGRGADPYHVSIQYNPWDTLYSGPTLSCTCPAPGNCKHLVCMAWNYEDIYSTRKIYPPKELVYNNIGKLFYVLNAVSNKEPDFDKLMLPPYMMKPIETKRKVDEVVVTKPGEKRRYGKLKKL